VFSLVAAACGGETSDIPSNCNPLGGQGCLLPWPSSVYEVADSSTATGRRLAIPLESMPTNFDNSTVDPAWLNRWDGFSPSGAMLASFETGVSAEGLPSWKNPDESLAADSPIVLLDMDTGERAPFFAEVDQNTKDITKRNLIIRPLARLHGGAHYVVAIRKAVKAADGSELVSPPAFVAAVSGGDYAHSRFDKKKYADMFAALATAGVDKTDLALAWDFHTASDEFLQSDLLAMRDAAVPAMGANGANLSFTAQPQPARAGVLKSYIGTFKSPDFLTAGETDESILRRDASHKPQMMGMRDAQFAAIVPECVTTQPLPRPTIVFGHGLFGSAAEYLDDNFVIDLAQRYCFVIVAGDFIGLTSRQLQLAPLAVNDMNRGTQITEKLAQSVIDFIALETITRGPFKDAAEFAHDGMPVIDPTKVFYVGGSLGGIMGNTFMAYDPNITRGVLAVPGGVWSMLFERSNAWTLLMGAAQSSYEDPEVYQLNIAFLGMGMEPYDPITTAAHVTKDNLPGVPKKNILIWYSLGDCLVTNITTEMIARTMGLDLLSPAVKPVWGLEAKEGPLENGVTNYDEHRMPLPSDFNIPPATDNGTHSRVNRNPSALRQVEAFLLGNQQVIQTCGGATPAACDCATGACN
jgi:pimeloyl-ACP methyl ester carboxylesterase